VRRGKRQKEEIGCGLGLGFGVCDWVKKHNKFDKKKPQILTQKMIY